MPRKIPLSRELKRLEGARRDLKFKVKSLAHAQRCLLLRHSLLHAWCESLSLMQVMRLPSRVKAAAQESAVYTELLQREVGLLQQLAGNAEACSYDALDVLHPGIATIAPIGDPMAYFRHHVLRSPLPEAATMTAVQLAMGVRESTLQASVPLHSLEGLAPDEQVPIIAQMQEIWDGCMHAAMSLITAGREDIVEMMNIINLDTLQPDAEGSLHIGPQTARTVGRLHLTPAQHSIIATGTGMYLELLESIRQEWQQLQLQFAEPPDPVPLPVGGTDPLPAVRSRSGQVRHDADSLSSRQAQLEAEQQRSARPQLLMQKEYILRMGGMAWVMGCLTWPQVTKAAVLCWPFPVRMSLLAKEIKQQWEQQQQAQLQQELEQLQQQQGDGAGRSSVQEQASPNLTATGAASGDQTAST